MMLKGKTVLVTGATGFVGGRLVEKLVLEQQARVRTLVRNFGRASRLARFPIEFVGGDITDAAAVREAMQGCDIVFHCAHESALPGRRQKLAATQGTQNVCEAALEAGIEQMVHVSSVAVYGPTPPGDLTEASPWQPTDHSYMVAKRLTERLVLDRHQEVGLPVVVLQPTAVYGPYCRPWTLQPVSDLKTGLVPLVDGGQGYCSAVYIDDVIEAMVLAATNPTVRGEVFLISGEEPVTWKEFYGAFEAVLGLQATVEMSEAQLVALRQQQTRRQTSSAQLLELARDPRLVQPIIRMPPVRGSVQLLKHLFTADQRRALKTKMFPNGSKKSKAKLKQAAPDRRELHVPNETLLSFYTSRTRVRIDKAKQQLGYAPQFDFERGMALTAQFIHWANLT